MPPDTDGAGKQGEDFFLDVFVVGERAVSDIFISHVEEDEVIALDIAAGLEAAGYSCWYYERDGLPGVRYLVQIDKAIEQAQAIVVVISRDSLSSSQVDSEVERAHESAKHFIPILHGIKHFEFQNRKPVWRMAMGTATSLPIPVEGVAAIIPRIVAGAQELGIERHANHGTKSRDMAATEPAESPERKGFQVLAQDKESMDSNSSIAASETNIPTAKASASASGETPRSATGLSNVKSLFNSLLRWATLGRKTLAIVAASFVLLISLYAIVMHFRSQREPQKTVAPIDFTKITLLRTMKCNNWLMSMALSPDGKILACGNSSTTVTIFDTQTGEFIRGLTGPSLSQPNVAFSSDGRRLATAGQHDDTRVWDAQTGKLEFVLKRGTGDFHPVAFSPDGKVLATGGDNGFVLWDAQSGELRLQKTDTFHANSLAFSPNGTIIASAGRSDATVRLWDSQTGALLPTLHRGSQSVVQSVAFSPNGNTLASALVGNTDFSTGEPKLTGIEIDIWDAKSGALKKVLTGHTGGMTSMVFLPDGRTLVSGNSDGTVRLWEVETGQPQRTLADNLSDVSSVCLSTDGRILAIGDRNGTVTLWAINGQKQ